MLEQKSWANGRNPRDRSSGCPHQSPRTEAGCEGSVLEDQLAVSVIRFIMQLSVCILGAKPYCRHGGLEKLGGGLLSVPLAFSLFHELARLRDDFQRPNWISRYSDGPSRAGQRPVSCTQASGPSSFGGLLILTHYWLSQGDRVPHHVWGDTENAYGISAGRWQFQVKRERWQVCWQL